MGTVVVGGGLAGLSAAHALAAAGREVVLLESRDQVGGRTASWLHDGMPVESGLHRVLGVYTELPALLERSGVDVDQVVSWEDVLEIRLPDDGPSAVLGVAPLHEPLRLLGTPAALMRLLSPREVVALAAFLATGMADYVARPLWLDRYSVSAYARARGVSARTIERVLVPFTAGIFFLPPHRFAATNLFGLLVAAVPSAYRSRVGAFRGGMTEVMAAPVAADIVRRGGEVRTGVSVRELVLQDGRVSGVRTDHDRLDADHVVLATSIGSAQALLREPFADHPWFRPFLALPTTPAATVQLELDGPSMDVDRTTFGPGTALASFAEQSRTTFRAVPGRLSAILQPPERYLAMDDEAVLAAVVDDGERLGLRLRGHVVRHRTVHHPADFPSLEPGHLHQRPRQRTPVPGLVLAGDHTRQRWLASMEGAVLSGRLAARAVLTERVGVRTGADQPS